MFTKLRSMRLLNCRADALVFDVKKTRSQLDHTVRLVNERLEFVDIIDRLNRHFLDPNLIKETPEGGWTHPWKYFDALRNYLLLTCFDLLGQPNEFRDFQSWLSAAACADERTQVAQDLTAEMSAFESADVIHRGYLRIYGARNAFIKFINEVLTPEARKDLLYSVLIRKIDPVKNIEVEVINSDERKINWLYSVRNSYTHRAENTGSPAGGLFDSIGRELVVDGKVLIGYEPNAWESQGKYRIEYGVRDWPRALKNAVRNGLAHRANAHSGT